MMRTGPLLALVAALLVGACSSSPESRFFALEAKPAGSAPHPVTGPPLTVAAVTLPPTLQRRELVVRGGEARVALRGSERWAGPLDVMIQRALARNLARRLDGRSVLLPDAPVPGDGREQLALTVERFSAGPEEQVVLAARWSLLSAESTILRSRRERVRVPLADQSGETIAAAMSTALARFADAIAAALAERGPDGADGEEP